MFESRVENRASSLEAFYDGVCGTLTAHESGSDHNLESIVRALRGLLDLSVQNFKKHENVLLNRNILIITHCPYTGNQITSKLLRDGR